MLKSNNIQARTKSQSVESETHSSMATILDNLVPDFADTLENDLDALRNLASTKVDTTPLLDNIEIYEDTSLLFENNTTDASESECKWLEKSKEGTSIKFDDNSYVMEISDLENMDYLENFKEEQACAENCDMKITNDERPFGLMTDTFGRNC